MNAGARRSLARLIGPPSRWSIPDLPTPAGTGPGRGDLVLSGALALAVLTEVILGSLRWPLVVGLLSLLMCALVPYRRVMPLAAAGVAVVIETVMSVSFNVADIDGVTSYGGDFAMIILAYAVARWARLLPAAIGYVIFLGVMYVTTYDSELTPWTNLAILAAWLLPAAVGVAMRFRAQVHESRITHARLSERNKLARELHDSVAHHVSAIAVQAQAASFVASQDPKAAATAIASIEETANTAIDEMRRMVGILRSDDDIARTVASTSLLSLVTNDSGPAINVRKESDLQAFPSPVRAAVYRVAQEAITNARRHSDGCTFIDVDLCSDPKQVRMEIVNDGTPTTRNSGGGFGLVGMVERVEALGGDIRSEARPGDGWVVQLDIPLGANR